MDKLKHLVGIRGLALEQVESILQMAMEFREVSERSVKKVPSLRGKTIVNLFLEPSTRTRTSFELAGKRLSADVVNISASGSSVSKGETLYDTANTIMSMSPSVIVLRHQNSGAAQYLADRLNNVAIVNAGDGLHEHPTHALLDALTIRMAKGRLNNLKILMVGDAFRSRVARSNILLHRLYGNEVQLCAPPTLARPEFEELGVKLYNRLPEALEGVDVVMSMRTKHEYLNDWFVPSLAEFSRLYCINESDLAKYAPESIVLAPGPFVRGTEVNSDVIDGQRSRYALSVENGVAVRMAVLYMLSSESREAES